MSKSARIIKIFAISLGHLCQDMYSAFLSPILPFLIQKFDLTYTAAGFIEVVRRIPFLFGIVIGVFSESLNLKYIVIITPTVTAASMCLMGIAPEYYIVLMLAFITGLSSSFFHVPAPVLVRDFAGRRIGLAMSAFQIGGEAARTIGPLVVTAAFTWWTLEGIYKLIPLGILSSVFFYFAFKDVVHTPKKKQHNIKNSILQTWKGSERMFGSIFGMALIKSLTCSVIYSYLPTYLVAKGKSAWFAGIMLSLFQAAAIISVGVSGFLSDRINRKKLAVIFAFLTPAAMFFVVNTNGTLFIIAVMVLGFVGFANLPVILTIIQKSGLKYPSVGNGINMSANFVLNAVMVLLCGRLADMTGMHNAFKLCAWLSLTGLPFVFLLKTEE